MQIWELEPSNFEHSSWRISRFKDRAVIRAASEKRAREIAGRAFESAAKGNLGDDTPLPVWSNAALVKARRLEGSKYPEDGPEAILEPPQYDHEWKR